MTIYNYAQESTGLLSYHCISYAFLIKFYECLHYKKYYILGIDHPDDEPSVESSSESDG